MVEGRSVRHKETTAEPMVDWDHKSDWPVGLIGVTILCCRYRTQPPPATPKIKQFDVKGQWLIGLNPIGL